MSTDEINTIFQPFMGYIYMRAQVNSSTPANIMDWYKHSNTSIGGSKCILNRFWCVIWRPKQFLIKMFILHNGLHTKLGLYIFHIFIGFEFDIYRLFIVPNLKSIHAVFAMLRPFQWMLVPRFSTGWSVAKLFWVSVMYGEALYHIGYRIYRICHSLGFNTWCWGENIVYSLKRDICLVSRIIVVASYKRYALHTL